MFDAKNLNVINLQIKKYVHILYTHYNSNKFYILVDKTEVLSYKLLLGESVVSV